MFNLFLPTEDIFKFVRKLMDTASQSSKIALRRIQKDADKRQNFRKEVEDLVGKVRESKIPVLDDMPKLFNVKTDQEQ